MLKSIKTLTMVGLLLVGSLATTQKADALVLGVTRGRSTWTIAGVVLLFVIPIVGIVLDEGSNSNGRVSFNSKFPFLVNNEEGDRIYSMLSEKIQSEVSKLSGTIKMARLEIGLDKDKLVEILDSGDFSESQKRQVVSELSLN